MPPAQRRALGSRYELLELIGTGATGHVWRAWDRTDGIYRAAKVLRNELTADPEIATRFLQERTVLMQVCHPHIVEVRDLVAEGESLAIVMDLHEGGTLRDLLDAEATLPAHDALSIIVEVLDALAALHERGIVHGDVKPENILLTPPGVADEQGVRLADFGIARLAGEPPPTGLLGTPTYMPPELLELGSAGPAGDLYAAGVVLHEMVAGGSVRWRRPRSR